MSKQKQGIQHLKGIENPRCKNREGEEFINNDGEPFKIIKYHNANNCDIQFEDGTIVKSREYSKIQKGQVKNPFTLSIYKIGFIGQGDYKSDGCPMNIKSYELWSGMFERCYDEKRHIKMPTYISCSVDERWHNFQIFAEWFHKNYIAGLHLDKDILKKGNKIYSPETCCFVPNEINALFKKSKPNKDGLPKGISVYKNKFKARIGKNGVRVHLGLFDTLKEAFQVYKTEKEKHIKEVADKYKNQITKEVYQVLYNYKVEITD